MYDVITFGSATVDIFADTFDRKHLSKKQKDLRYNHIISYEVGEKILIRELHMAVGGGGTNTAVTFARFGLKTGFCGSIGQDSSAILVKDYLSKERIDFLGCESKEKTGLSIVLDSIEHDRTILAYKGANNSLSCVDTKDFVGAKVFYFSSLLEKSFETHKKMLDFAEKHGIKVAFNPSSYQAILGYKKLSSLLSKTDFLILNKEEAQDLLENTTPHVNDLLESIQSKIRQSPGVVIITDGGNGAFSYDGHEMLHVLPNKVKVVESTGAGDAFASGFMAALLYGKSVKEALSYGAANSESVISHYGAKETILTYKEVQKKSKKVKVISYIVDSK